jgi:hypothetical protein
LNTKCHGVTLMVKLLIISVSLHSPQEGNTLPTPVGAGHQ